jgi:hypothetical protein
MRWVLVLSAMITTTLFAYAQPAQPPACPPQVVACVADGSYGYSQSAGSGPQNIATLSPSDFDDIFSSLSQNLSAASSSFSNLMNSLTSWLTGGASAGRAPPSPDPPSAPPSPHDFANSTATQSTRPQSTDTRSEFRNAVLDGNTGSFKSMKDNPYDDPNPSFGDPPSGVDPYRPGCPDHCKQPHHWDRARPTS